MILSFTLSMPCNNSWNGRWSGEKQNYVVCRSVRSTEKANSIIAKGYFSYSFGDGWVAAVKVRQVDKNEAAKLHRSSDGFCGYDWMIQSIIDNEKIQT
jgi:hypothetical protein